MMQYGGGGAGMSGGYGGAASMGGGYGGAAGMGGGYGGAQAAGCGAACGPACGVGPGEDCTACGVGCGGTGGGAGGAMSYVGTGHGDYIQETNYKYVGCGGDFDVVRPRRDFTCIITGCALLSLLLMWLLGCLTTSLPFDCLEGSTFEEEWSQAKRDYCCMTVGRGCPTTRPATALPETTPTVAPTPFPTPPPTPPPTRAPAPVPSPPFVPPAPAGPVDPYNCAVDSWMMWAQDKKDWCCNIHHICDGTPTSPPPPADPFDCDAGFANWQAGWSVEKKSWCCANHGKGCG